MGRSNKAARSRNNKGRLDRRQKGVPRAPKRKPVERVAPEKLVLPDGQCTFRNPRKPKARFATAEKAAKALRQAQQQRARTGSAHVEKRYYACPEGGCDGYHLTSRESYDANAWKSREMTWKDKS